MARRGQRPAISLLIATRNRALRLESTLVALRWQKLEGIAWELLVADNGSTDNTPAVLSGFRESLPLTVLREPTPGKSRALNRLLEIAQGNLVVFTDDDVAPSELWLAELLRASQKWMNESIFCGPIFPSYPSATPAWMKQPFFATFAYGSFESALPEGPLPDGCLPFGANFAVRGTAMLGMRFCTEVGPNGKSYAMGCEIELLRRLVRAGEGIIYVPSASVKHFIGEHQVRLKWLCRRAFNNGRGFPHLESEWKKVTLLMGVPRYLVRQTLEALPKCVPSLFRGKEGLYRSGAEVMRLLGEIYECRLMVSRSRQTDPKSFGPVRKS